MPCWALSTKGCPKLRDDSTMALIKILAWAGWEYGSITAALKQQYRDRYREDLSVEWTHFLGGSQLIKRLTSDWVDIILGDREILLALATEGMLVPLSSTPSNRMWISERYPHWLAPWRIEFNGYLFGLPLRWGTTSVLGRSNLTEGVLGKASRSRPMKNLIESAERVLLWAPGDCYYLPSMAFMASAIDPKDPFVLSDKQVQQFRALLLDTLARKTVIAAGTVDAFTDALEESEPDLILGAGDWIVRAVEQEKANLFRRLKDSYTTPEKIPAFAFFETVAVSVSTRNRLPALRVAGLFGNRYFRRLFSSLKRFQGSGYVPNPGVEIDEKVYGPGFSMVEAEKVIQKSSVRSLPRDIWWCSAEDTWQELWHEFLIAARINNKDDEENRDD